MEAFWKDGALELQHLLLLTSGATSRSWKVRVHYGRWWKFSWSKDTPQGTIPFFHPCLSCPAFLPAVVLKGSWEAAIIISHLHPCPKQEPVAVATVLGLACWHGRILEMHGNNQEKQ